MIIVGIISAIYSSIFYLLVDPLIVDHFKDIIFTHLDGNQILFDNFLMVTRLKGILKLDILLNLVFITCLVFILLSEQVFSPLHPDDLKFPLWLPWLVICLLFCLILFSN